MEKSLNVVSLIPKFHIESLPLNPTNNLKTSIETKAKKGESNRK